jgi:hypothetical protein
MTIEEKEFLAEQFKNMNVKIDLLMSPVKNDIVTIKETVTSNTVNIKTLELFKEGHQQYHMSLDDRDKSALSTKRWNWEIIASTGIISTVFFYLFGK